MCEAPFSLLSVVIFLSPVSILTDLGADGPYFRVALGRCARRPAPLISVRRRGKNIYTRRGSRILCVVVEKITTRRREGVGVDVEKMKKVDELRTKIRVIYLQQ